MDTSAREDSRSEPLAPKRN